jgi:hypothetical protein
MLKAGGIPAALCSQKFLDGANRAALYDQQSPSKLTQ